MYTNPAPLAVILALWVPRGAQELEMHACERARTGNVVVRY